MTKEIETRYGKVHFSTAMTGKLEGINALSTSVVLNMFCQARQAIKGSICEKCYAQSTLEFKKSLGFNCEENYEILANHLLDEHDFPFTTDIFFRIEAFGDVATVTQCRNYIRFARRNPQTTFSFWTKNPAVWDRALKLEGKPENMIAGLSSLFVNQPENADRWTWIDFVFTVYTADFSIAHDIEINCGGRKCIECRRCYTMRRTENGPVIVNEMLKSQVKRYYKLLAEKAAK